MSLKSSLGLAKNVIQGPLTWLTDSVLVAAVSQAGGLGCLGPLAGCHESDLQSSPLALKEKLANEIRKTRKLTRNPFGLNIIGAAVKGPQFDDMVTMAAAEGVNAIFYTTGSSSTEDYRRADVIKQSGLKLIYRDMSCTAKGSRTLEALGVDVIVVTGFEQGGPLPPSTRGLFALLPEICDAVKTTPIVAAGGIVDRRSALAASALGASGVVSGSAFIASEECRASENVKSMILKSTGSDLHPFECSTGRYHALPGVSATNGDAPTSGPVSPTVGGLLGMSRGMLGGSFEEGFVTLGEGIGQINSVRPVLAIVDELNTSTAA